MQIEDIRFEIADLSHPSSISILIERQTLVKIGNFMMTLSETNRLIFKLYHLNFYYLDTLTEIEPREIKTISRRTGKSVKAILQQISKLEKGNIKRKDKIVGQILNMNPNTVRTRIKRTKGELKKKLDEDNLNEDKDQS